MFDINIVLFFIFYFFGLPKVESFYIGMMVNICSACLMGKQPVEQAKLSSYRSLGMISQ